MRVRSVTNDQLVLRHRTMAFMLAVAVGSLAYGVWTLLRAEDWKGYLSAAVLFVVGVGMFLLASSSLIVFDLRNRSFRASHRRIWGKPRLHLERLDDISAIVLNRDTMPGSVLVVIAIRVRGKDLPITMFGTPFPAAAFHSGLLISRFVGLPLMERDRIVIQSSDEKLEDAVGDAVFQRLPQAVGRARQRRRAERGGERSTRRRPVVMVTLTCPNCGQAEELDRRSVMEPSAYSNFVAARSAAGDLILVCGKCRSGFVLTKEQVESSE